MFALLDLAERRLPCVQHNEFAIEHCACRKYTESGQLGVTLMDLDKPAVLQAHFAFPHNSDATDSIPFHLKKVIVGVEGGLRRFGEHGSYSLRNCRRRGFAI